jgi:hypothetical protein
MHPGDGSDLINKPEEVEIAKAWKVLFPDDPVPETLSVPCCAQFAVSRDQVYKFVPLEKLKFLQKWLLGTQLDDAVSGRIFEYLWHWIFLRLHSVCYREDLCYCDGYGVCFGGQDEGKTAKDSFASVMAMVSERKLLEYNLGKLKEDAETDVETEQMKSIGAKIEELKLTVAPKIAMAKERGKDPRLRAMDCDREWSNGDGF